MPYHSKNGKSKKKRATASKNARSIAGIKRSLASEKNQYGLVHEARRSTGLGDAIIPICPQFAGATSWGNPAWTAWGPNSTLSDNAGRASVGNVHLSMQFTAFEESGPQTFRVYHVKLRPESCNDIIDQLGRGLVGLTSGTGQRFLTRGAFTGTQGLASTNSCVRLNPRYFEVKKRWVFSLGGKLAVGPATQISTDMTDSYKNIEYVVPMGNQILGSANGEWRATDADNYKPENLNYILVFTDGTGADLESPSYSILMSTIMTAKE